MSDGRTATAQLTTARLILAMGEQQITEHTETGAHADRIDQLHTLKKTWTARIAELEPLAHREAEQAQGKGKAFGL
ncbi:hypothetical protein [Leucobacter aridicollis]|uniref:hypothetical protein n=1 Tax=Leucobacter aridicollis TaxID=283878 RepID=UPI0021061920|nr:hypothetical protein [Leucobacter aridicollis]UTX53378.1 hypothetical protein KI794_01025 [Leucobacter aridicollis]